MRPFRGRGDNLTATVTATAQSPGESGDCTRLSTIMRCAWIDDGSIRECAVKYFDNID